MSQMMSECRRLRSRLVLLACLLARGGPMLARSRGVRSVGIYARLAEEPGGKRYAAQGRYEMQAGR